MPDSRVVELGGETFRLRDEPNEIVLSEFLAVAEEGADSEGKVGASAMWAVFEYHLADGEFGRFRKAARKAGKMEALFPVLAAIVEWASERPTPAPSDSTDGRGATPPSSTAVSSSPVIAPVARPLTAADRMVANFEQQGRPDRGVFLLPHATSA